MIPIQDPRPTIILCPVRTGMWTQTALKIDALRLKLTYTVNAWIKTELEYYEGINVKLQKFYPNT